MYLLEEGIDAEAYYDMYRNNATLKKIKKMVQKKHREELSKAYESHEFFMETREAA